MPLITMKIERDGESFTALVYAQNEKGTYCICDTRTRKPTSPRNGEKFVVQPSDKIIWESVS